MVKDLLDKDLIKKIEWVNVSDEGNTLTSPWDRLKIKMIKNPFVPLGTLCTCAVLCMGINSFRQGNKYRSQKLMRWRVGFQAFTIVSMVCGIAVEKMIASS